MGPTKSQFMGCFIEKSFRPYEPLVSSLPLTPQLACHAETVAAPLGQPCVSLNVPKPGHIQNLRAGAAVGLSCLALRLVGAGVPRPLSLSACLPEAGPVPLPLHSGRRALPPLCCAGLHSWPLQPRAPLPPASFPFPCPAPPTSMVTCRSSATSSLTQPSSLPSPVACRRPQAVAWTLGMSTGTAEWTDAKEG